MTAFNIKKILIPIDFSRTSELAIKHGAFMAKIFKADILMIHVVEKHFEAFNIVEPALHVPKPAELLKKVEEKLEEIGSHVKHEYGVTVSTISSQGNVCDEIVNIAKEQNANVIVMGTHGSSGIHELIIGSNAYKVATLSECPVITVRSKSEKVGFTEIVAPIDNSEHSRQKVNHLTVLAKHYGARIHILGLLNHDADSADEKKFNIKLEQVQQYFEKHGVPVTNTLIKANNHATQTMAFAQTVNADLIATMTDQENDKTGLFMGPYAQQIVNHSHIPVLSIRPEEHPENIAWVHPY